MTAARGFWEWVDVGPTDQCWLWKGATRKKGSPRSGLWYGVVRRGGKVIDAHRYMFFVVNGYYPEQVRHTCDNPPCVNPFHLLPGSHAENMADMVERDRVAHGENHYHAKLTEEDVRQIRRRRASSESYDSLALSYGVSRSCIVKIVRRVTWRRV